METIFLALVIFLLGLAVFDLVVGVSNDAVNFLTSAVGSNAATFTRIMIVASIGILIGASSSGGMMEIAKTGVFLPDKFTFQEVIFIYLCVMLSDILLLDFFNSLKLPTSTTISIVFELLGASIAVTLYKMYKEGIALSEFATYINTDKALQMIVAIFVSVAIAFLVGWLVQFLLRAITTFDYKQYASIGGAIFGGVSVAVVLNFIINVGLKSSPLRRSSVVMWMTENFLLVAGLTAAVVAVLFFLLNKARAFDPFRFITLLGTFALAMAFASNDLVNFIGVPVASYDAYQIWRASGEPADIYLMSAFLVEGAPAATWMLIVAGVIMVATLATSKKARNVIQTTVNLSRQKEGVERFSGNAASRGVVRGISGFTNGLINIMPAGLVSWFERRYAVKPPLVVDGEEPAAFDFVRASSNLIVAAFLISVGTSLKLPLSTTYVSFMVLMGTSLADRAWNRDSAVYRVSGVFTVISGWFMTAIAALTLSSIFALTVMNLEFIGVGIVFAFVVIAMTLVNRFTDRDLQVKHKLELPEAWFTMSPEALQPYLGQKARKVGDAYGETLEELVRAIEQEDRKVMRNLKKRGHIQQDRLRNYTARLNEYLGALPPGNSRTGRLLVEFFYLESLLVQQSVRMIEIGATHVLNLHKPLEAAQIEALHTMVRDVKAFCKILPSTTGRASPEAKLNTMRQELDKSITQQVNGLMEDEYNYKNSLLYLNLLLRNLESTEILMRMDELTETAQPSSFTPEAA